MDTTEKDIRNLFANSGELDRDEVAMLLLQLVERIQNLERAPQRTWVGLNDDDKKQIAKAANYNFEMTTGEYAERIGRLTEEKLKELNT